MVLGFVFTMVAAVGAVHLYLWHRLVRSTTRPGRLRRALTWVVAGLGALVVVTFVGSRVEAGHWLAWPGYLWLAIMFYLLVFLLVLEVPRAVAWAVVRRGGRRTTARARVLETVPADGDGGTAAVVPGPEAAADAVPGAGAASVRGPAAAGVRGPAAASVPAAEASGMSRRLFLGRATAAVAGVSAIGTVGYGVRTALGDPVIEPVKVTLPHLDQRLSGLRFAVVSDIHLGPLTGRAHTERIVRMINSLKPDVVTIVGDLVDGTVAELGPLARPLRDLESRYGAFFVTGNHEYYTSKGPGEWIEELGQLGVRSLRNERVEIRHQGGVLDLAGVNDVNGATMDDGPDFAKALGGRDTSRSTVLLAHQPVQVTDAARYGVDLQLSGHTHGGQIAPFNLLVPLQQPVVSGLATVDGVQVYVTRGAGFWGPPVRVGAPPEITLLELRS
ncbi:metallophosphoesterase [Nonomuraea roseoviolacea]|uniref:MPP superfamily phosphohydrolase n=1 Tax=Nonomuraea roseoviolacea subsp. carminata TaxID=160689 RepID=A0ABT1K3I9_9ACTN|nr:metallophosphoesterase [Nonomuraea roseoviolacea]MCP2347614.1 putative MPP superfamily phosphohydrolase [Nonomuraea roseoviolacea subsp. carminata]